jgi:tetratricopeptide (TPR) repeat protein
MFYSVPLLSLLLFATTAGVNSQAQPTANDQNTCKIWGQVTGATRLLQDGLEIELVGQDKAAKQKVHASMIGNFDFRSVPAGEYQFRVVDRSGAVIHQQTELLSGKKDFVLLFIHDPKSEVSARNIVSFAALQHKTPDRARDALRASQKAAAAGDLQNCIQHLQEALQIDPDFAEAHSDLAARYAKMGRIDEALQHAHIAFNLNPSLPEAGCNFALMLLSLKRYPDAEVAAREMLRSPNYLPELHGVIAISLIEQQRNLDEAFQHLRQATTEIPFIMLLAARSLVEIGKPDLALSQVKAYLQSYAHECERSELEAWVAAVQSQLTAKK